MAFIETNDDNDIIQYITVGLKPEKNGYAVPPNTPEEVIKNIFSYKFIDGHFIYKSEIDEIKFNRIKNYKLSQLSSTCQSLIIKGIDIGEDHFSLTPMDQTNILSLASDAQLSLILNNQTSPIMYHADGKECREFSTSEILTLAAMAKSFIKLHTTYYNFLKQQVLSKTTNEDIIAVQYGQELESPFKEKFEAAASDVIDKFEIEKIEDTFDYNNIIYDMPNVTIAPLEYKSTSLNDIEVVD